MEKYLQYLISDIQAEISAASEKFPSEVPFDPDFEEMEDLSVPVKLSDIIALEGVQLPPASLLKRHQLSALLNYLRQLLDAYHIFWHLPPNIPQKNRYEAFRKALCEVSVSYHPVFGGDLDFCELLELSGCPYHSDGSKCTCDQYRAEFEESFDRFDDEMLDDYRPFNNPQDNPDEPWITPQRDEGEEDDCDEPTLDGIESIPDDFLSRYFLDVRFDNLGDESAEDDPRINWHEDDDDDQMPF